MARLGIACSHETAVADRLHSWVRRLQPSETALNLSLKLLQLTLPGVPDVYQGSEMTSYSLVDPDNRRPVDFGRRSRRLDELDAGTRRDGLDDDKLWVTSRALRLRREVSRRVRSQVVVSPCRYRKPARDRLRARWPGHHTRDPLAAGPGRVRLAGRGDRTPAGFMDRRSLRCSTRGHDCIVSRVLRITGRLAEEGALMKFEVWAPHAQDFVQLQIGEDRFDLKPEDNGYWRIDVDVPPGTLYSYVLDGSEARSDPRALRLPEGPEGPAATVDLDAFEWTDAMWRGVPLPGSVVYEMHVGTFTPEGTLDAAIGRLDHLVSLGVDIVEVMPLATFPGEFGWGYDGVGLYAVHEPYGGPEAFHRFVDACHRRGIGICLDVVYNHLGPSGNHLSEFGPYFTARYGTPWGAALNLDDADSDEVRRFVIENALMWFRDFHVDGLRLDAVHALFDIRAITLLEELSSEVSALSAALGRPLSLIAESDRNDPLTVAPREAGGLGLHAQWADDVHHALHVLLTGENQGYYADFDDPGALTKVLEQVFLHDGTYSTFRRRKHGRPVDRTRTPGSRFVVSLQTHDQVGNRAMGDRLSSDLSPGVLACGAALLLTGPGTPMLFMGEEWGARTPWQYFTDHTDPEIASAVRTGRRDEFASHGWRRGDLPDPQAHATFDDSKLDWVEPTREPHRALLHWYSTLITLRHEIGDLGDPRLDRVRVVHDYAQRTVMMYRGSHVVAINLSHLQHELAVDAMHPELDIVAAWVPEQTEVSGRVVSLPPESAAIFGPSDSPRD